MSQCPLCNQETEVTNNLTREISCERCGTYFIERSICEDGIRSFIDENEVYILSAVTRRSFENGKIVAITELNVADLIQSISVPSNLLEQMDEVLLYFSGRQRTYDEIVEPTPHKDYPLVCSRSEEEFIYLFEALQRRSLIEEPNTPIHGVRFQYRLTLEGWERIEQLKKVQIDSDQAFVAMWFSDKLKDAWDDGFEPALDSLSFKPLRVDLEEHNGKIDDYIVAQIRKSGILIADFTGHRGGVYFEAGFAMGLGIPVIPTCKDTDIENLHFDTRQYNHIVWESPEDLKEKLVNRIAATIPGRTLPDQQT